MLNENRRKRISMKQGNTAKRPSPIKRKSTQLAEEAARRKAAFKILQEDRRKGRKRKHVDEDYKPKHQKGK